MIEELRQDSWVLGELARPFGRGINLQIECADVEDLRSKGLFGRHQRLS